MIYKKYNILTYFDVSSYLNLQCRYFVWVYNAFACIKTIFSRLALVNEVRGGGGGGAETKEKEGSAHRLLLTLEKYTLRP